MMIRMPTGKPFIFDLEDYKHIQPAMLADAARWWARNATIMSSADPWKSHAAMIPIIALITPDVISFAHWLWTAHRAMGATPGGLYEQTLCEMRLQPPMWLQPEFLATNTAKWSVQACRNQMQELLDEVRRDSAVSTPGIFRMDT